MNTFSRVAFVLKEGCLQLIRAKGLSLAVVVIVASTLLQLSIFLGISKALDSALSSAREKFQMVVFLTGDSSAPDRSRIQTLLSSDPRVASVKGVTKEEALSDFRKDSEIDRMVQALGENPLTDSFSVILKREASENLEDLVSKIKKDPQVEEVVYGKGEWETMSALSRTVRWTGLFLGGFIFLTALFIVSNTLTLALWARREDWILLSRMGAPSWMKGGPYLVEGILQGLLGGLAVVLFLEACRHGLGALLESAGGLAAFLQMPTEAWVSLYETLLGLGIGLGGLGALLSLQKKWVKELR